jgi:hypothetical protein
MMVMWLGLAVIALKPWRADYTDHGLFLTGFFTACAVVSLILPFRRLGL